ncbi:MAG: 16S rRNA (guanine(527)-N(7))-methyltransferase RsmG [Deltaproteobacteria bacterium]|nr:16S rRNA (guanine(527)-N(7))-methyltransferase RsmG [Deltaproteobacteria bacterium]
MPKKKPFPTRRGGPSAGPRGGVLLDSQEVAAALELLPKGARELGLHLEAAVLAAFRLYLEELGRWNARINLTGLRTPGEVVVKHFLDSLAVLPFLGEADSLADVGAGAGFPGVPLKIVRPELRLTLVEGRGKKAAFLTYLMAILHLKEVTVAAVHLTPDLAARWGPDYGAVATRGALPLARFFTLAAPLLKPGGRLLALKGPNLPPSELEQASILAPTLNLTPPALHSYRLPLTGAPRLLVAAGRLPE